MTHAINLARAEARAGAPAFDAEAIRIAIEASHSNEHFAAIVRALALGWEMGALSDAEAQRLWEAADARRRALRPRERHPGLSGSRAPRRASLYPPKRPSSPRVDTHASILRRRRLAASGATPGRIACQFTLGEQAALAVVAIEVKARGACRMTLGEIAARAGVGVTTARNALRAAARLGLASIEERRRRGAANLANVVRIISPLWLEWIRRSNSGRPGAAASGVATGGGSKNPGTTNTESFQSTDAWRSAPRARSSPMRDRAVKAPSAGTA